jgi:hypothetical protein
MLLLWNAVLRGSQTAREPHLVGHALNDTRMEVLQDLVRPLELGTPQMQLDPFPGLEKPVRKASRRKRRRPS